MAPSMTTIRVVIVVIGVLSVLVASQSDTVLFNFDLSQPTTPFPHFWEECVGSGHALLALRADYREYLTRCHHELGFKYVRFHGLLDDDMSTYTTINGKVQFSFFNVDSIFDFLLSIDMKPLIELSFMPEALASGDVTVFHYKGNTTPPKNYTIWSDVIQTLVQHLVDRYGIDEVRQWPFEVWNEPNCGFWNGTQQEYFKLYQYTAQAVKKVDSQLRVGGPATCQSAWIPEFLNFTTLNNVPVDFISTHEYPTDITPTYRNVMGDVVKTARAQAGSLPLYYTEYNDGLYSQPPEHDASYAAAFIVKNVNDVQGYVDLWSWWTFSDIFEEQGFSWVPFYDPNGWGLLTRYGIPNPSFRAFQLLHKIGDQKVSMTRSSFIVNSTAANVEAYATILNTTANGHQMDILLYNFNVVDAPIADATAKVTIVGVPSTISRNARLQTINSKHPNPGKLWLQMGSPAYPTKQQLELLQAESEIRSESIPFTKVNANTIQFQVGLTPQSVAVVSIGLN